MTDDTTKNYSASAFINGEQRKIQIITSETPQRYGKSRIIAEMIKALTLRGEVFVEHVRPGITGAQASLVGLDEQRDLFALDLAAHAARKNAPPPEEGFIPTNRKARRARWSKARKLGR